jgi:hypothetical protein
MRPKFAGPDIQRIQTPSGEPYVCASQSLEERRAQPARLFAGAVAAPVVLYAASQLPERHTTLKLATSAIAVGMGWWSLSIWRKVRRELQSGSM